ncbi:Membrane associated serine protease, rhomboid family [Allokutzneria albata]|uniref:Membrane associated serine protease, rhomboid family n=1 Tax=Allokutzneria albata TaxID=211114 RepID=A0A1G9XX65_ALLAB|nr:Membrane associated serine protease, rhomboid family [Allokutzneria albata]
MLPAKPKQAAIAIVGFVAALYLIELIDVITNGALDAGGITPRELSGLTGIIWAPALHFGWDHLAANTLPVLVLGFLTMAGGIGQFVAVTATIWLVGGIGVWLIAPEGTIHAGASILIFGWLTFLLLRGFLTRRFLQIALAVVLFFLYGSALWGILPGQPGVSWQGHLFGAVGGVLAAWLVARASRQTSSRPELPGNLGV